MNTLHEPGQAALAAIDRSHPSLLGTWTIDPSDSGVSFAWRTPRLGTTTGRLRCWGIVHLDGLPPVGVIQFEQPSGLPVLTMALDPASVDSVDVMQDRWWTLRSESLEVLASGTWRVMATLIANGTPELVELHLDVDPGASGPDRLVLRGQGVLDRRAGVGRPASISGGRIQLRLAVRARRVES